MANNVLLLQNLPRFRGNLRSHEVDSPTPSLNVRTFFRSIENYFENNRIVGNDQKIRILFEQIDKTSGDAIDLVNCYAGRSVSYEDVREDFLQMYPEFRRTEFRHAAFNLMNLKVNETSLFCGMTRLENATRAITEAYLNRESMRNLPMDIDSSVDLGDDSDVEITCQDLLQNFLMHMFLATQVDSKVYDKLSDLTPDVSSTKFMSKTVQLAEKQRLLKLEGKKSKEAKTESSDVLYKVETKSERKCYGCNKPGHFKQDCPTNEFCKYCKTKGHEIQKCRKRVANNISYCTKCMKVGHEAKLCRSLKCTICGKMGHEQQNCWNKVRNQTPRHSTNNNPQNKRNENIRVIEDLDDPNFESGEEIESEH